MISARTQPRMRTLITPEGLPLHLEVAPVGSRLAAVALDLMVMGILIVALVLLFLFLLAGGDSSVGNVLASVGLLVYFIIVNGYFIFFELFWRGSTPGKRAVGLKVISANGGPLTTGAVFARNLMRDLELYLPLQVFIFPEAFYGPAPGWAITLASVWIFLFLLMPLFNHDRARCGDLVAGTLVVVKPEGFLLPDPADRKKSVPVEEAARYTFTDRQLEMYGIQELQTLEEIVRHDLHDPKKRKLIHMVSGKIARKIGWKKSLPRKEEAAFLEAFYKAQRRYLEQRLLMGERREHKRKGRLSDSSDAQ